MKAEEKKKILDAYLNKAINKEEMQLLLENGIFMPPIPWIGSDQNINDKKGELLERVFGIKFVKIVWVKA